MAEVKIKLQGITKDYVRPGSSSPLTVLSDVNLEIYAGEFVSFVGPSGCGKTTLLRIINGLMSPSSGSVVVVGGGSAASENGAGDRPESGFVFQSDNLYPWRSVLANVTFGLELQGVPKREAQKRARNFLEIVGLAGFEQYYPHQLSGGMRQRVNLARALTIDPDVLLMDEPFAALDPQTRDFMQLELLRIWSSQKRKTVLFVTHQIDEAVYLSDRVVVMGRHPGRVREVVPIDIARPRELHVKRSPPFLEYADRIWKEIEDEMRRTGGFTHIAGRETEDLPVKEV